MRALARAFILVAAAALAAPAGSAAESAAARVILLANKADPDSLRIARHYAEVRGVPQENIFAYDMPTTETITWHDFVSTIWQPFQDELVRRTWIDALSTDLFDAVGRRKYAIAGHRIAALVTCRGVPLRIENDPALYVDTPPFTENPNFRTNAASVDSELSLLAATRHSINGCVPNPLFERARPNEFDEAEVVKVGRLDGPTADDAADLVDRAVAAEHSGLAGRACFDLGGPFPDGDAWLEKTLVEVRALGFDETVDRKPETLPATALCDSIALYFGWHTSNLNGPFALPGFRFAPGAIAFHIHSFSARTLRSETEGWCGPLVARGAAATLGNVYEPYLQCTHRPDLLVRALARGWTLADAAYYALPVLSWQAVLIGDPLYRPFAVSLDEQWRHLDRVREDLSGYVVLRRMTLLEAGGRSDVAFAFGRTELAQSPSLVVGVAIGERLRASGHKGAAGLLGFAAGLKTFRPDQWALAREAAQLLKSDGRPDLAVSVYKVLLANPEMPRELKGPWLVEARQAALFAADRAQADEWKTELDGLVDQILKEK